MHQLYVFDVASAASVEIASPNSADALDTVSLAWVYFNQTARYSLITASLHGQVRLWHLEGDHKVRPQCHIWCNCLLS